MGEAVFFFVKPCLPARFAGASARRAGRQGSPLYHFAPPWAGRSGTSTKSWL